MEDGCSAYLTADRCVCLCARGCLCGSICVCESQGIAGSFSKCVCSEDISEMVFKVLLTPFKG